MKISVVTVCRNASDTIEDTIHSVKAQTYRDIEHLIVDGASTDGTIDVVRANAWPGLRWFSEPDTGLYDAMNKGLARATGDVIGFLNADDFFADQDVVTGIANVLERSQTTFCFGDLVIVSRHDLSKVRRFYDASGFRKWHVRIGDMPPHPTIYVRTTALRSWGQFNTRFNIAGDFDLLSRGLYHHDTTFVHIPKTMVILRDGGVSTQGLKSTLRINREIAQSLHINQIGSAPPLLWVRYLYKVWQLVKRPNDLNLQQSVDFEALPTAKSKPGTGQPSS